jgi:uncharacterized protein YjbI with pentapeptide repeats
MEVNGYRIEPGADLTGANLSRAELSGAAIPGNPASYPDPR